MVIKYQGKLPILKSQSRCKEAVVSQMLFNSPTIGCAGWAAGSGEITTLRGSQILHPCGVCYWKCTILNFFALIEIEDFNVVCHNEQSKHDEALECEAGTGWVNTLTNVVGLQAMAFLCSVLSYTFITFNLATQPNSCLSCKNES